jgi:hypothetical protein
MKNPLLRMEFYETYYYANIIQNILRDPFDYLRNLHSWAEDAEYEVFLPPFPKVSRLHSLIRFIIHSVVVEDIDDVVIDAIMHDSRHDLWLDRALRHHGLECPGFRTWLHEEGRELADISEDDIHDYHREMLLGGQFDGLLDHLSEETFFVVFGNRALLQQFNNYASGWVSGLCVDEAPPELRKFLKRDGVLRRVHIPEWARRAAFFRDRGACATCNRDISGLISLENEKNFDHIIPLDGGGLNDVTNLQLLCNDCNKKKGAGALPVSRNYQRWYPGESVPIPSEGQGP